MRCDHGFETTVVPCPEGCVSREPVAPRQRRYIINGAEYVRAMRSALTEERVAAALNVCDSVADAARMLRVTRNTLGRFAGTVPRLSALLEAKAAAAPKSAGRGAHGNHPGFVDMTGQTRAGCKIIRRALNVTGNARWLCELACGHEGVLEGIAIREAERHGRIITCRECRESPPGTVLRRARG